MRTVSPYAFASLLILIKIMTMSMYVPLEGENPALTAVVFTILSAVKLISFIPIIYYMKKNGDAVRSKAFETLRAVFFGVGAVVFILAIADSFSTMIESVYPDRFTKFGITAVFFIISAYIASMGIRGVMRCTPIMVFTLLPMLLFIFYQMRDAILTDRINLYSSDISAEVLSTLKNLLGYLVDYFIFFALLPYIKKSPGKAAGIYIASSTLISAIFLLTSASIMGGFWGGSGYSFFTLSFCTCGSVIDRSDAIYLAISSACGVIGGAALMLILNDSIRFFMRRTNDSSVYIGSAAALTAIALAALNFRIKPQTIISAAGICAAVILFIASCFGAAACAFRKGAETD